MFEEFFLKGITYSVLEDYIAAESYFRKCIDLELNSAKANYSLGHCLLRQNNFDEAEVYLRKAVELDKGEAIYLHTLNECLSKK